MRWFFNTILVVLFVFAVIYIFTSDINNGNLITGYVIGEPNVAIIGDCNSDGKVDDDDLTKMQDLLQSESYDPTCDFDNNDLIDIFDLGILRTALRASAGCANIDGVKALNSLFGSSTDFDTSTFNNDPDEVPICPSDAYLVNITEHRDGAGNIINTELKIGKLSFLSADDIEITGYYYNVAGSVTLPNSASGMASFIANLNPLNRVNAVGSTTQANNEFSKVFTLSSQNSDWTESSGVYIAGSEQTVLSVTTSINAQVQSLSDSLIYSYSTSSSSSSTSTITFSGTIPNFEFIEDNNSANAFDLDDYFSISDNLILSRENFIYAIDSSIGVQVDTDKKVGFFPNDDVNGYFPVQFNASRDNNNVGSNIFYLNITSVNDPPELIKEFGNISLLPNSRVLFNLSKYFKDDEDSELLFYLSDVTGDGIRVTLRDDNNDNLIETLSIKSNLTFNGGASFYVFANDSEELSTRSDLVTVDLPGGSSGGNDKPRIIATSPASDIVVLESGQVKVFGISVVDLDDEELAYFWYLDGSLIVGELSDTYAFISESIGIQTLRVEVNDGQDSDFKEWIITTVQGTGQEVEEEATVEITRTPKESNLLIIIALIIGIIIALVIIVAAIYFIKSKKRMSPLRKREKPSLEEKKKHVPRKMRGVEEVLKGRIISPQAKKVRKIKNLSNTSYLENLEYSELMPLVKFINKYRQKNINDASIRKVLLEEGWTESEVNKAFEKAGREGNPRDLG